MRLIINQKGFKTTVIFIHGFRKSYVNWNISEDGKDISIERILSEISNTILVDLNDNDYLETITDISTSIYRGLIDNHLIDTKITLIGHSYGIFYCLRLAEMYPNIFSRLLLLDPTIKNEEYLKQIQERCSNILEKDRLIEEAKLRNFDDIPSGIDVKNKIIVRIHLNISSEEVKDLPKIKYLYQLVNKNTKSRLIVHYDVSHMIHYKIPHIVIDGIREIYKI